MASTVARSGEVIVRQVKPIVSANATEARRHVLVAYKKWQRALPKITWDMRMHDVPLPKWRLAIKQEFVKNQHLSDPRAIDRLVHKANIELYNCKWSFNNPDHIRNYLFHENVEPKPTDFLSRFFAGKD